MAFRGAFEVEGGMPTLELVQPGRAPYAITVTASPVLIGRAPSNDLVVSDDQVSWHHAAVWMENGQLCVRDMGSRNGTMLNGRRIRGLEVMREGDVVSLGPDTELRVREQSHTAERVCLLVEQVEAGVRIPIRSDRFHIGGGEDADLCIPGAEERLATLLVDADGQVTLATDDSSLTLQPGQQFEVAGYQLRVVYAPLTHAPTVEPEADRYPYRLWVTLNGSTGPEAKLTDERTGMEHVVDAENRVILLYLLARRLREDLDAGKSSEEAGWTSDEQINVGVWGRSGTADSNNLHVLVYRLRKELREAGFDPWFIEKRRRAMRLRIRTVEVD